MSFASFFRGLKFGSGEHESDQPSSGRDAETDDSSERTSSHDVANARGYRRASFGRAAEARASFGKGVGSQSAATPGSGGGGGGASSSGLLREPETYQTPSVARLPRAERRMSFAGGRVSIEATGAVAAAAEAVEKVADGAGKAMDGLLKTTGSLFGSIFDKKSDATPSRNWQGRREHPSTSRQPQPQPQQQPPRSRPLTRRLGHEPVGEGRSRRAAADSESDESDYESRHHRAAPNPPLPRPPHPVCVPRDDEEGSDDGDDYYDEDAENEWSPELVRDAAGDGRGARTRAKAASTSPAPHRPVGRAVAPSPTGHAAVSGGSRHSGSSGGARTRHRTPSAESPITLARDDEAWTPASSVSSAGDGDGTPRPPDWAFTPSAPPHDHRRASVSPTGASTIEAAAASVAKYAAPSRKQTRRPPRAEPRGESRAESRAESRGYHRPSPGPSPGPSPSVMVGSNASSKRVPSWPRNHRGGEGSRPTTGYAGAPQSAAMRSGGRSSKAVSPHASPQPSPPTRGRPARRVPSWPAGESAARVALRKQKLDHRGAMGTSLPRSVSFALTHSLSP